MKYPFISGTSDKTVVKAGDILEFQAGGVFKNSTSIQAATKSIISSSYPGQKARIVINVRKGWNVDIIAVDPKDDGTIITDIEGEVQGDAYSSTVFVKGTNAVIKNVSQVGSGWALRFDGAIKCDADMIEANKGNCGQYCIAMFGSHKDANGNEIRHEAKDCKIRRFDIWAGVGATPYIPEPQGRDPRGTWHALRGEHTVSLQLGDPTLTLPALVGKKGPRGRGFAYRAKHTAAYPGVAVALNDGTAPHLYRGLVEGILTLGPLLIWGDNKDPKTQHHDWLMYNPIFEDHDIAHLVLNVGTKDFVGKNSLIRKVTYNQNGGQTVFPKVNGVFEDCLFLGKQIKAQNVQYTRCKHGGTKEDGSDSTWL